MAIPFLNSRTQWLDADGNPISYGRVSFYEAGTSTPKSVYTSKTEAVEADNPMTLDSGGYHQEDIWLGSGEYKYELQKIIGYDSVGNPLYTTVYTKDNIPGAPISPDGIVDTAVVSFVDDLRDITGGEYDAVYVLNYSSINDNGGGWFIWSPTETATDDGGMIISSLGDPAVGRFVRQVEGNVIYNTYYGIKRNDNTANYAGQINNMSNFCSSSADRYTMWFIPGTYNISAHITFHDDVNLVLEENVQFVNSINSGNSLNVVINSRNVKIDQDLNICNMPFTRLFYNPINGPTAKTSWYDNVFGLISDAGFIFEHIEANENYSDLIVNQEYLISTSYTPNMSEFNLIFEDDGYIQINNQDFFVKKYINNHGGRIWGGDYNRLSISENVRIRVSDFFARAVAGHVDMSSSGWSKLVLLGTGTGSFNNSFYFDTGSYVYGSDGSPTGETARITLVFENGSVLTIDDGFMDCFTVHGTNCIVHGGGVLRSGSDTQGTWFVSLSDALEAGIWCSTDMVDFKGKKYTISAPISLTLRDDLTIKNLKATSSISDEGGHLITASDHVLTMMNCEMVSSSSAIGIIRATNGLKLDGCYFEGTSENSTGSGGNYLVDVSGSYECRSSEIISNSLSTDSELVLSNGPYYIVENNRFGGNSTSTTFAKINHVVNADNSGETSVFSNNTTNRYPVNLTISNTISDSKCSVSNNTMQCGTFTHTVAETVHVTDNNFLFIAGNTFVSLAGKLSSTEVTGVFTGNYYGTLSTTNIASTGNSLVFKNNVGSPSSNYIGTQTVTLLVEPAPSPGTRTISLDMGALIPIPTGIDIAVRYVYTVVYGGSVSNTDISETGFEETSSGVISKTFPISGSESAVATLSLTQMNEEQY